MPSMEETYKEHAQTVYRFLLSMTHDNDLAEELTQETFYQAVKCVGKYDGSCKISTWLCAIAKNQLHTYWKKHPTELPMKEITEAFPSAESSLIESLDRMEALRQLHCMEEPGREVMYLRLFGEASFREIGDIMGKTENWARVTYYRGKEKLAKELRNNE